MKKPCRSCPFRRTSLPGWLGAAMPEEFALSIARDEALPCHESIDYEDPEWLTKWESRERGEHCIGSLILARNVLKLPRFKDAPKVEPDRALVFGSFKEFIEHHRASRTRSWKEQPRDREQVRSVLGLPPCSDDT